MKKSFIRRVLLATLTLLAFVPLMAQGQVKVTGVVSGSDGEPLIGASVIQKGTNNGVITDLDGNYAITVAEGVELEYSCIGYVTKVLKAQAGKVDVVLDIDNQLLDEVVVVGYGVQKKSDVTGAISQVKSEDLQARSINNATQALQGKTAGVQVLSSSARPGASPQVRIRGISSNGSCDPLYVVDGRIASDIAGIDPNDIESMEVLKDGASAAIYGAQAGNGVILITTRKGKGDGRITYDYQFTSQSLATVPKVMNAEQYAEYYLEAGRFDLDRLYRYWDQKTNTDWARETFENSIMQRHNITFSAGNEKASLYTSLSYLNNNGIVAGDSDVYNRLTGMINASWKIKKWLEIGTNNQIEYYKARSVAEGSEYGSLLLSVLQLDPLTPTHYTEENLPDYMRALMDKSIYGELLKDKDGRYYAVPAFGAAESANPFIMRDGSFSISRGFNINGSTYLNLNPIKGLTITSRFGYRLSGGESYGYTNDHYSGPNSHQSFMSVNASASTPTYWQWENFANYNRTFGSGHNFNAMVGVSYSESRSFGVSGSISGSDGEFGFKQDDPLFYYFAYATAGATKNVSNGEERLGRKYSYFGRLNYDYKGKYIAQVSLRADAADSSVLPSPNRWGYFPAVSAGWTVSEENFMAGVRKYMNHLKLRVSWGQNGSTASLGGYSYKNVIASSGSYPISDDLTYLPGYSPTATGNESLKWETSEQFNVGFDARFFSNKLTFSMDYFDKTTKDLIVTGITPSTVVGNKASPVNAGSVKNNGLEIELGWQDQIGDFHYSVRGNFATLNNKVTYLHPTLSAIDGTSFHTYGAITRFETGKPAWYFYGYKFAGIDPETGNPNFVDVNEDGKFTDADKTMIGKGYADANYGITINLAWKGFDFLLFGTGTIGNDIYCCLNRSDYPVNRITYFTEDRWTPAHTNATMPRAGANDLDKYYLSDASVFDGSYFKIKQMQLGYNLPQSILKHVGMQNLRIYGSLDDFFTFTKYPGFDPEITGVGNALGVDKGNYPNSKKVVFGVTVTF